MILPVPVVVQLEAHQVEEVALHVRMLPLDLRTTFPLYTFTIWSYGFPSQLLVPDGTLHH